MVLTTENSLSGTDRSVYTATVTVLQGLPTLLSTIGHNGLALSVVRICIFEDVPLEALRVFIRMPGQSYCRRFMSLASCPCAVFLKLEFNDLFVDCLSDYMLTADVHGPTGAAELDDCLSDICSPQESMVLQGLLHSMTV